MQVFGCGLQSAQEFARIVAKHGTVGGEVHLFADAIEERGVERFFQAANARADSRLGAVHARRRLGHAQAFGKREESLDLADVHE